MKHWFWQHEFKVAAVLPVLCGHAETEIAVKALTQNLGLTKTYVLERCACGKYRVNKIAGTWTLEDLRGA